MVGPAPGCGAALCVCECAHALLLGVTPVEVMDQEAEVWLGSGQKGRNPTGMEDQAPGWGQTRLWASNVKG